MKIFQITFAISVAVLLYFAIPLAKQELELMQSMEDERVGSRKKEEEEFRRQAKLQELCGGENATVVLKINGGADCYSTSGRKIKTIQGVK